MNRFVIVNGLPYLYANNSAFAVRWDKAGFTVGDAVDVPVIPYPVYSEREVKAKCAVLDSIGAIQVNQDNQEGNENTTFDEMTLAELKDYAKENGINLNGARTKDSIIEAILAGQAVS